MIANLVWLRNDLRLDDNPALAQARAQGPIRVVFCATVKQWLEHQESKARIGLKAATIIDLAARLAKLGIPFDIVPVDLFSEVPAALARYCQQYKIEQVWFNAETPLDEQRRDQAVCQQLDQLGIQTHDCGYDLIVPCPVLTKQNTPFKIFTPFYRQWLQLLENIQQPPYPAPEKQGEPLITAKLTLDWAYQYRDDLWPPQESAGLDKLSDFCERHLQYYDERRDFPALPATSTLSPYLANGQLGPRRCLHSIQFYCAQSGFDWHENVWLKELAWRDFYRQLLLYFPHITMEKPFQPDTEKVRWRNDEIEFKAWCEGQTGFPIVDAAMRQLLQTGWMHNRLRMISASFLSKLLLVDWRWGEHFFMTHLVDGEFAANNGGWQWSASTGCDAAPYFRVFNPTRQSERFDPEGNFIRRFVPELNKVNNKAIHDPPHEIRKSVGYVEPIIDYKRARKAAISAFDMIRDN